MAVMLTDMPSDRPDALIKHPFHRENGERLVGFIEDLRECYSAEDFMTFQRELCMPHSPRTVRVRSARE
ncbi:hypothetical protein [Streptomyces flaveus]|uniref:hypothetical protein n=1 Tax=Streptomyces flaveus TaxID=66370 RepID=UPI003321A3D4